MEDLFAIREPLAAAEKQRRYREREAQRRKDGAQAVRELKEIRQAVRGAAAWGVLRAALMDVSDADFCAVLVHHLEAEKRKAMDAATGKKKRGA